MLRTWSDGEHLLAEVRYPAARNFGGRKLLLLRDVDEAWLSADGGTLDPHFICDAHPVVARFAPTESGLQLALRLIGKRA